MAIVPPEAWGGQNLLRFSVGSHSIYNEQSWFISKCSTLFSRFAINPSVRGVEPNFDGPELCRI